MNSISLFIITFISTILISCNEQNKKTKSEIIYITSNDTTGQLMDEDELWQIIDDSRIASNNNYQIQIKSLKHILTAIDSDKIIKFDNTFTALMAATYDNKLWGASYVINGGCSDDCFEYFREYIIAHGKEKFYETYKNPESCVDWIKSEMEEDWEGISYAASEVFKEKTGNDIPRIYIPKYELKGQPFDESKLSQEYPNLTKKFFSQGSK